MPARTRSVSGSFIAWGLRPRWAETASGAIIREPPAAPVSATIATPRRLTSGTRSRISWDSPLGSFPKNVFDDNKEKWSGDHCIDRSVVPGILLATKPIHAAAPGLTDVTASVLAAFGLTGLEEMRGKPIW